MDDFFHYGSKIIIIIPIIVIILALIFRFNEKSRINYSFSPSPIKILTPTVNKKINIKLNKRWYCHYKNQDQEYLLKIDNGKVDLEATISGQFKRYDLSAYSGLIKSILNMDINQIESLAKPYLPKGVDLKSLIESCKKI